ncbi:MAG: hypothetical protein RBR78_08335 [Flavobacteriaceae bacterium]|jgi:hypothetical protein|nr:hypothetical protein [Flavobacteriaceae bacterium]
MKKKIAIANLVLMITVIAVMLVQSVHLYKHWLADFSEDTHKCSQTHSHHHDSEDCSVCDFSFGFFLKPDVFHLLSLTSPKPIPYLIHKRDIVSAFPGKLFSLRAPPHSVQFS